jgi:1,4-dihydroxy-2-naphthoate octaprenyltransferase
MYVTAAICIGLAILLGILPIWSLLMTLSLIIVIPNMKKFHAKQVKSETFHLQIDNHFLFNGSLAITLLIGILLK